VFKNKANSAGKKSKNKLFLISLTKNQNVVAVLTLLGEIGQN